MLSLRRMQVLRMRHTGTGLTFAQFVFSIAYQNHSDKGTTKSTTSS